MSEYRRNIFEDSWVYQEIAQESEERGLAKGREEVRQTIIQVVKERFPGLEMMARQQAASVTDMHALNMLLVNIASTQEAEVVRRLLADISNG